MAGAKFRTDYEAQKWQSLERADKAALDKLGAGTASPQDIRRVQALVSKYNTLATSVFNKGLKAIELAAQDRVARIEGDRAAKGKPPLAPEQFASLMTSALQDAWADQGPELVVIIEEMLSKESQAQDKRFGSMLHDKLRSFHEERAANDARLKQHEGAQEESLTLATLKKVNSVPDIIEDRVEKLFHRVLKDYSNLQNVGGTGTAANADNKYTAGGVINSYGAKLDPLQAENQKWQTRSRFNENGELVQVAQDNEEATGAVRRALDKLEADQNSGKKVKDEESKAKIWWRSLKSWAGDKWDKAKKAGLGVGAGLLVLAGKLLMTQLMGGTLWRHIEDYLSVDKLKEYASSFLDWAMEGGKKIVSYIVDKLNPFHETNEDIVAKSNANLQTQDAAVSRSQSELARWKEALAKNPNDPVAKRNVAKYEKQLALQEAGKKNLEDTATQAQANISAGIKTPADFVTEHTDKLKMNSQGSSGTPPVTKVQDSGSSAGASDPLAAKGAGKGLGSGTFDTTPGWNTATGGATFVNIDSPQLGAGKAVPAPATAGGPVGGGAGGRPVPQGTGAPTSSLSDLRRGSSVDGILGAVNLGMLTG